MEEEPEPPPDFASIDKLVQEYTEYRQMNQNPNNSLSPDEIVEKIMKCFDTGDYPNILYLWDTYVAQKLDTAEAHIVQEANVSEFYMHIHCATCPFRQSFIRDMPNPGAAGKIAARSMTIFRHYVETKGKTLAATPDFHEFKHLHKIAFPPTHPKYQHLFYQDWITRTRELYFKFLIPFLKERAYPALCYALSNQNKLESPQKSTETLLLHAKEKEKRTAKIAKALFEAASDFVDMIGEDGSITKDSIEDIQSKLKAFGKALLPHSPGGSNAHLPEDSLGSIFGDVDTVGLKKKKKHKKKKPHYDFNLIGVDLSSMIVELSTELSKHLQEGLKGGTSSLSVDLEMAAQSAMQGCLLIKALRDTVAAEEAREKESSPRPETIPEGPPQESLSPRSVGGSVDKVVSSMTQGDLFGVTGAGSDGPGDGDGDKDVVSKTALPFELLLEAYTTASEYIRSLPVVEEPGEEESAVSREDKMLIDTLGVSRFFVEDYISLVAMVCTSASGIKYVTDNENGVGLYTKIIQFLLDLKPNKSDMMVKLHVVCLCTMISIGHKVPACLEVFIQKSGIQWLAATLDGLFSLDEEVSKSLPDHENYVDLCMGLLHLIVRAPNCRKRLFESADVQPSAVAIASQLVNLIIAETSALKDGKKKSRASATPPTDILIYLLDDKDLRNAARESGEVSSLKALVAEIEKDAKISEKLGTVRSVLKSIEATEEHAAVGASVSDLVYSVGVRNLVFDMLGALKESEDVMKYREENSSYATSSHILEKYKQSAAAAFSPV